MNINEFINLVLARVGWTGERYGQAFFNVLAEKRPDISEVIRGTELDPFYQKPDDAVFWKSFTQYIIANWEK